MFTTNSNCSITPHAANPSLMQGKYWSDYVRIRTAKFSCASGIDSVTRLPFLKECNLRNLFFLFFFGFPFFPQWLDSLFETSKIIFPGFRSNIIGHIPAYQARLESWLTSVNFHGKLWKPCYSAAKDGWDSSIFHEKCDGKGATLTIARFNNTIFGGFTDHSWGSMLLEWNSHSWQNS